MIHSQYLRKSFFPILLVLFLFPISSSAQKKSNQGKEFYVAFGENQGGQFAGNEDQNFFALFITGKIATSGVVEVKALGYIQNFTTTPGEMTTIELPDGKQIGDPTVEVTFGKNQEEKVAEGIAVHITSNDDIAVFGMNHKDLSSDAFMALPVDVLGTEYRAICYQTSEAANGITPGEFWIVGVTDSTNVTITPQATTRQGINAGTQIKILLYKGDVYLVQGDPLDGLNDLTGSHIESDQPIAVFSGHVRTEIPSGAINTGSTGTSRDHLCEQLPPVTQWGDSVLVVPFKSDSLPDLVRILSSTDGNVISINGTVAQTINAGKFYEIKALTGPVSIQAKSPILVGQYMHTSKYGLSSSPAQPYGDPAYSLVFPVEQFGTSYTFMLDQNSTFTGNFITIVADSAGIATMMLDAMAITTSFSPIPGSRYVYAQISFTASQQGAHTIHSTKPFGITVYAMGAADSYACPGGASFFVPLETVQVHASLSQSISVHPNPFLQSTTIGFSPAAAGFAYVSIYNLLGTEVAQIFSGELEGGAYSFAWDGSRMPPGIYECIIRMNGHAEHVPVILMH